MTSYRLAGIAGVLATLACIGGVAAHVILSLPHGKLSWLIISSGVLGASCMIYRLMHRSES